MKFRYYMMSMALCAAVSVSFTSCDDDDSYDDIMVVKPDQGELTFTSDEIEVKIGAENKVGLPIATSSGAIRAFSLNPEVATVVYEDGVPMIEGLKNGLADIMVSDGDNNYKGLQVKVYTTEDNLQLSTTDSNVELPYGLSSTAECGYVVLGNGGYTVTCDNSNVYASIDSETGVILVKTTVSDSPETANLTVTDCRGLSADMKVTMKGAFFAYTPYDLNELTQLSENTVVKDGYSPTYLHDSETYYAQTVSDGMVTFGGKYEQWGYLFAIGQISYPEGTAVGTEVNGTLIFGEWGARDEFPGKVKLLVDDNTKRVAVWYDVDAAAKKLSRGYACWMK